MGRIVGVYSMYRVWGGGGDCRPVSQKMDSQDTQILKRVGQNYWRRLYIYILVHKLHCTI